MGINTALLFLLVHEFAMKVFIATLVSAEFCTLLRFLLNEYWVFGNPRLSWKRLWRYHVANCGALIVWWATANLLTGAGVNYLVASILAVGLSTGLSFASNFFWVWKKQHRCTST